MRIENARYILSITNVYPGFSRDADLDVLSALVSLRSKIKDFRKPISQDLRKRIQQQRQLLKTKNITVYECRVYFKKYRHTSSFTFEYIYDPNTPKFSEVIQKRINSELKHHRMNLKVNNRNTKVAFEKYLVEIIGNKKSWVYNKPGQILTLCTKRKVEELYAEKLPKSKRKYIGIELEFCAPIEELDFSIILWKAGIHKFAQIKKDNSLRPKSGEHAYELALLLPESGYKKNLKEVCKILESVKAKANDRRCGLHVHLDMRFKNKAVVYNNLVACQSVLASFLDPIRYNNEFCRTVTSRLFPTKFNNVREERYKTINAASYYKYKTLEVRMHEGSIDFKDISQWIDLLIKIGNHKTRIRFDIKELTTLKKRIKLNEHVSEYFQDKACFWQLQGPQRSSPPTRSATGSFELERMINIVPPRNSFTASPDTPSSVPEADTTDGEIAF